MVPNILYKVKPLTLLWGIFYPFFFKIDRDQFFNYLQILLESLIQHYDNDMNTLYRADKHGHRTPSHLRFLDLRYTRLPKGFHCNTSVFHGILLPFWHYYFFCFRVFVPTEIVSLMYRSHHKLWRAADFLPCFGHLWLFNSEGSLASHTNCDAGHHFYMSSPKTRDTPIYCRAFGSGAVTTFLTK